MGGEGGSGSGSTAGSAGTDTEDFLVFDFLFALAVW